MTIGFVGIGLMGEPMARRLLDAGHDVRVWARRPEACAALESAGATRASDLDALFAASATVVLMLRDEAATDEVLARGSDAFAVRVRGRRIVVCGTNSASYSAALAAEVEAAGGTYIEAPVSGSRVPAERGELVVMLAGSDEVAVQKTAELLSPLARAVVRCGEVPDALRTKVAVNHFMMAMVASLVEAIVTARQAGVDPHAMVQVIEASSMSSALASVKAAKLLAGDDSPQAAIADVVKNADLVTDAARRAGAATPIFDEVARLFRETAAAGFADADMVAVARAIAARSA